MSQRLSATLAALVDPPSGDEDDLADTNEGLFAPDEVDVPILDHEEGEESDLDDEVVPHQRLPEGNLQELLQEERIEVAQDDQRRPDIIRNRQKRCINSIETALNGNNYNPFEVPIARKEYTASVKMKDLGPTEPDLRVDWTNRTNQAAAGRRPRRDVILENCLERRGIAKNAKTHLEAWELFMNHDMIQKIVAATNRNIAVVLQIVPAYIKLSNKYTHFHLTDAIEIRALIGLMYYRGLFQQVSIDTKYLWNDDYGHPVFGSTMSCKRFNFLMARLSYDDKATRTERWKADRFAAIREIFEDFNTNCCRMLTPPELLAIDETLYPTRGQISIKQYNPKKPAKYGILFKSLCSVKVPYAHSIIVAAGKPKNGAGPHYTPKVVLTVQRIITKLESEGITLAGRNISTDRYYTSIPLLKWLLARDITTVGTLMSNRQGIPKDVKKVEGREEFSYEVYWDKQTGIMTLHSYVVRTKSTGPRNVLLLSSLRPLLGTTKDDGKNKPAHYKLYDYTKGGVDIVDQRMGSYTTKTKSRKWTTNVFNMILDQSRVNAQTIWSLNKDVDPRTSNSLDFGLELAKTLVVPHIARRNKNGIQKPIVQKIIMFLGYDPWTQAPQDVAAAQPQAAAAAQPQAAAGAQPQALRDRPLGAAHGQQPAIARPQAQRAAGPETGARQRYPRAVAAQQGPARPIRAAAVPGPAQQGPARPIANGPRRGPDGDMQLYDKKGNRRKCFVCKNALPKEGYKQAKDKLSNVNIQCQCCGQALCPSHCHFICLPCSNSFERKGNEDGDDHRRAHDV